MLTLSSNKMFNLVLMLSVVMYKSTNSYELSSYARVSRNGGSISEKSNIENRGNDPSSSFMSHVESTLIDKQNNVNLKQQQQQQEREHENVEEVEEKSEGRAIKSNYYFPLSDFLTKAKAMQSNSYKNDQKEGRLIVYPSYTQNIDQTRRRYDMTPSTGQVAQKRFAPGEAYGVTIYKAKHPEKFGGYKYPSPPKPAPPPVMMMMNPVPQTPSPPIIMTTAAPPPMMNNPPPVQYLPPSKFLSPIVVADTTTEKPIMTVIAMRALSATKTPHFLPTMPSDLRETTSMNPIIDLLSFNNKVNTSYMPPELHAIKDSIDNNHVVIDEYSNKNKTDVEVDTVASADLHKFPPKTNSIYQPSVMVRNNMINYKSRDSIEVTTISREDLHKFPPNIGSSYLRDSYMTSPSGVKDNSIIDDSKKKPNESVDSKINSIKEESLSGVDLNKFPPNINSAYLPPDAIKFMNLYNSYLPPASGQQNEDQPVIRQASKNLIDPVENGDFPTKKPPQGAVEESSVAPEDLNKFPPNLDSEYLPPEMIPLMNLYNSYLPPASGQTNDTDIIKIQNTIDVSEESSVAPDELNKFPPNLHSAYLPPEMMKFMNLYNSYLPPASGQQNDAKITVSTSEETPSVEPEELHKFPPNLNSAYLPPEMMKFINLYNSYLPPASGQTSDTDSRNQHVIESTEQPKVESNDLHKFPPNLNSVYLPPEMMKFMNLYNSYLPPASGQQTDTSNADQNTVQENDIPSNDVMYLPPKDLHNFPPNIQSNYLPPEMMKYMNLYNSYLPPAAGDPSQSTDLSPPPLDTSVPSPPIMNQQANGGGMQMSQAYSYNKPTGGDSSMMMQPPMMASPAPMMDMMMPSGPMDMPPMDEHDHHHHHHHHDYPSYPDVYYDDHHHHHHHVEETTTTTTEAPSEPRVKKYSYYYLGRKLWYIPLYFTFWFCLYVAALIIRSIGRHKVDLPNHYVARSLHDMSHQELVKKINKMTEFTMAQIDDFKNKYL